MPEEPRSPSPTPSSSTTTRSTSSNGAASSAASRQGSSPFVGNPGPAFDPKRAADAPAPVLEPAVDVRPLDIEWEEQTVRSILTAKGRLLHTAVGVAERDWEYTDADLAAIAPPMTRILNRYEPTRAAAAAGDELAVGIGFTGYFLRSWSERRAAIAARDAGEPEPLTDVYIPTAAERAAAAGGPDDVAPAAEQGGVQWKTGE